LRVCGKTGRCIMSQQAKLIRVSWMAGALLPLLAGIAGAVNSVQCQMNQPNEEEKQITPIGQTQECQGTLEKSNELIGTRIINGKGERLGTVADIVLTPDRRTIDYGVLSYGGFWGVPEKLFAVPWSHFQVKAGERALVLNIERKDIGKARGFDRNHWPTMANENWLGIEPNPDKTALRGPAAQLAADEWTAEAPRSGEYVDAVPIAVESPSDRHESLQAVEAKRGYTADARSMDVKDRRLSKLLGVTVRNLRDEDLGKLDNAMIDVRQGKLAFGIVAIRSGFLGMRKDFAAIPWSALDVSSQPGIARLDAGKPTLAAIAFHKDHFPNLEDPQYSRQLDERFHVAPSGTVLGFVPGEDAHDRDQPAEEGQPLWNLDEYGSHSEPQNSDDLQPSYED
jgi:sporulation protein YlmC with PRC-barrel domain